MQGVTLNTGADVPAVVTRGLEVFANELKEALGDKLVALVLYGGIARDEYYPYTSDVNVMILVPTVTTGILDAIGKPVRKANLLFRLQPLVLGQQDLERSTDSFPVLFFHMKRYHIVLHGEVDWSRVHIERSDLRLHCEFELKKLLFELRSNYIRAVRPERVEAVLAEMISPLLSGLSTLMFLEGDVPPKRDYEVIKCSAERYGMDESTLRDCIGLKSRKLKLTFEQLKSLYDRFMEQVEKAAVVADALEE